MLSTSIFVSVDTDFEWCYDVGMATTKKTSHVTVRIDSELYDAIKNRADANNTSITEYVKVLLNSFSGIGELRLEKMRAHYLELLSDIQLHASKLSSLETVLQNLIDIENRRSELESEWEIVK